MDTPPLRIVHWHWQEGVGGIDRVVTSLLGEQQRDPTLAVRSIVGRRGGGSRREDGLNRSLRFRHGLDVLRYPAVRRELEWADVVHLHAYNPVVGAAVARLGRPCVYTDHGSDRYPSLRNRIMLFALQRRFVRTHADVVTVNSCHRRETQESFYGLDGERLRVVYNGVDFSALAPARPDPPLRASFGIGPGDAVVGTVAVFQMRKRLHLLLDAFARARPALPPRTKLLVVGDGMMRPSLEERVRRLGLRDHVVFAGYRSDAPLLLSVLDAFVLPTEGEAFGLAAAEALAMGKPAIVFADGGGLVEIVRDGETGFVVRDVDEAAARLRTLLADRDLRTRMGERAAVDVRRRFSVEKMAAGMRRCYEAACERRRRRTP